MVAILNIDGVHVGEIPEQHVLGIRNHVAKKDEGSAIALIQWAAGTTIEQAREIAKKLLDGTAHFSAPETSATGNLVFVALGKWYEDLVKNALNGDGDSEKAFFKAESMDEIRDGRAKLMVWVPVEYLRGSIGGSG